MANGAGGTPGGVGHFFAGLAMLASGLYLFLHNITVTQSFGFGYPVYTFTGIGSGAHLTSGMILLPFGMGIAMIFRDAKSLAGWILAICSLAGLVVGVIASLHFAMRPMSLFDFCAILVLIFGGLGLFLRSLRPH